MKLILKSGLMAAMMFALVGSTPAHAIFGSVGTASGCKAAKAKCVSKMKSCLLGCYNKSIGKGLALDTPCLDKCRNGFYGDPAIGKGCNEKADAKGGIADCGASFGDGPVVRSKVEAHVLELSSQLNPAGTPPVGGNKCAAGKNKCVNKYNACVLGIVGKAFKAGTTVGDLAKCNAILQNVGGKASCVQKLEDKYGVVCLTQGDQGVLQTGDDAFVNDIIYGMVGAGDMNTQRCLGDTSVSCTSAPGGVIGCGGPLGTCEFFFGAPLPLSAGGVTTCVTSQWAGGISGTFNQQSGASTGTANIISRVYNGILLAQPCPKCQGLDIPNDGTQSGTCNGGPRNGLPCDANGESPVPSFGLTSLDCPPSPGGQIATLPVDLSNTNTGTVTATVGLSSPSCNGSPGNKCLCASCSLDSQYPCKSDADCSAAAKGTCTNAYGEPRKPNACIDNTLTGPDEKICSPTVGGEGECSAGPVDTTCTIETFRGCLTDADCTASGDTCSSHNRDCFPGYNGSLGDTITASGSYGAPHNHTGTSNFASIFCVAPTGSASVNSVAGLPGPGRLALGGVSSEDGTDVACPTVATFLPTSKGGVLDTGWTGISHDAKVVGQGKVTVSVTGCVPGIPPNCGTCTYTGPVAN
jgi:hypothetical protein